MIIVALRIHSNDVTTISRDLKRKSSVSEGTCGVCKNNTKDPQGQTAADYTQYHMWVILVSVSNACEWFHL